MSLLHQVLQAVFGSFADAIFAFAPTVAFLLLLMLVDGLLQSGRWIARMVRAPRGEQEGGAHRPVPDEPIDARVIRELRGERSQ